jgi:predicted transcriptional regulator of viral defense system
MKLIDAYTKLRQLQLPVLQTQDVAAFLDISINHANKILSRIAEAKQIINIRRGTWVFPDIDPLILPNILTDPFPSYLSLQTALYYHGMISQIPNIIYAVSLARTYRYKTPIATVSVHHIQPTYFFGYKEINNNALLKIASPEKTLIDIFYLSQTKSKLFRSLPEVELPKNFSVRIANSIINKITSVRKRTLVKKKFFEFLDKVSSQKSGDE